MPRKTRHHIDELPSESDTNTKHLTKQEFGRLLYRRMIERGWNQSELARRADVQRYSVSAYVRGLSLPGQENLVKLANAFGVAPVDLLPNTIESAIDEDMPSIEMKVSVSSPGLAWLRVNRLVSLNTATRVIDLLENDKGAREAANAS